MLPGPVALDQEEDGRGLQPDMPPSASAGAITTIKAYSNARPITRRPIGLALPFSDLDLAGLGKLEGGVIPAPIVLPPP
jgi:hypothetical protein